MDVLMGLVLVLGLLVLIFLGPEWGVGLTRGWHSSRKSRQAP